MRGMYYLVEIRETRMREGENNELNQTSCSSILVSLFLHSDLVADVLLS